MLSTLRWAGSAGNTNSLPDPNSTFDPALSCVSGEEAARDALVMADVPKQLVERLAKKPQEIGPNCLFENAESILHFYEEDIVLRMHMRMCTCCACANVVPTAGPTHQNISRV